MSELSEYRQALGKILPVVIPLAVVGVVAGVGYSLAQPKGWQASTTLYVHRVNPSNLSSVYDYDGYYAQQAAQQYTDTVVGLLKTQDLASWAAQIASDSADPATILNGVQVKKVAPQLVSLTVTRSTQNEARDELIALAQATAERSAALNDQYGRTYKVEMVTGQPLLSESSANLSFNALLGLLGGGAIGLGLALALEYLRR